MVYFRGFSRVGALEAFFFSGVTVGIAFLVHELAHKFIAQRYGCWAEFRSFNLGLVMSIVMAALGGILFAAPGAVVISGVTSRDESGRIAAVGPVSNLVLAVIFVVLGYLFGPHPIIRVGLSVNAGLALFNLLPFGAMDGLKVMDWNSRVWLVLMLGALSLVVFF